MKNPHVRRNAVEFTVAYVLIKSSSAEILGSGRVTAHPEMTPKRV
jgi:hypothetical protein